MQLSVGEILQYSPDEASTKAAKGLVIPAKWPRLEFDELAIWGECQGSGSKAYQVQVDRSGPAFRCSCPSRKFPCKHGLALMLLMAQYPANFSSAPAPPWVSEWLSSRQQRAEKQQARATEKRDIPADPQAAARRERARLQRMAGGLEELERWLSDRLRQGLAQLPGQAAIWEELAKRMIDAQLPGLALRLRRIGSRVGKTEAWPGQVLAGLGQLQLLIDAFRHLDTLPPAVQQDIRAALGMTLDRDSVLATGERLKDDWLVLGQSIDAEDGLWSRRVWLQGRQSVRRAMLLDFAHGTRRFEQTYVTASSFNAELAFFPGNLPLRAIPVGDIQLLPTSALLANSGLDDALEALTQSVAANPWFWPQPMLISDGIPCTTPQGWSLLAADGYRLPLHLRDEDGWHLLAESGGTALNLFGEWDGEVLRPLSAWHTQLAWMEASEGP